MSVLYVVALLLLQGSPNILAISDDTSYVRDLNEEEQPVCAPTSTNTAEAPARLRIYVADIPQQYTGDIVRQWQAEKELIDWHRPWGGVHGVDDNHAFRTNDAYSADFWLYTQLLQSPMRVHCLHDADIVFIPAFFLNPRTTNSSALSVLVTDFFSSFSRLFAEVSTVAHVLGYSRPLAHLLSLTEQQDQQALARMWVLSTSKVDERGWQTGQQVSGQMLQQLQSRVVTVPTSSWVHFSRGSRDYRQAFDQAAAAAQKHILAVQVFNRSSTTADLVEQCRSATGLCTQLPAVDAADADAVYTAWDAYASSWYCILPGTAEEPVDRSFVDCILGGAIPVLRDAALLPLLPFSDLVDWNRLLVVLPVQDGGPSLLQQLQQYHSSEGESGALQLLRQLYAVKPLLQYSLNPVHDLVRVDRRELLVHEEDALTATWKAVLRTLCRQGGLPQERCARVANYQRKSRTAITLASVPAHATGS